MRYTGAEGPPIITTENSESGRNRQFPHTENKLEIYMEIFHNRHYLEFMNNTKGNQMKIETRTETVDEQLKMLNEELICTWTKISETLRLRKQFPRFATPIDGEMKKANDKIADAMSIISWAMGKVAV
jgi:hypothetical protein